MNLPSTPCPCCFGGSETPLEEALVVFIGAPVEHPPGRPGASLAPCSVRWASATLVYWSVFGGQPLPHTLVHDSGDVRGSLGRVVDRVGVLVKSLSEKGVAIVGGVHSVSIGVARVMSEEARRPLFLILDAHMDGMEEYEGSRLAPPCTTLRVAEAVGGGNVVLAGVRVGSKAELERLERLGVRLVPPLESLLEVLEGLVEGRDWVHVSIDVDVMDPALAPGATNPEPFGVEPKLVARLVYRVARLARGRVTMDIVEYTPLYDPGGVTSYLAARLVLEYAAGLMGGGRN